MNKSYLIVCVTLLTANTVLPAQNINKIIKAKEVKRIEKTLAGDDMQGRKPFTPGIEKAAAFIAAEMKKAGLQTFNNNNNYFEPFEMVESKITNSKVSINEEEQTTPFVNCISTNENILLDENTGYTIIRIAANTNFREQVRPLLKSKENILVLIDTSHAKSFKMLKRFSSGAHFKQINNVVFVLTKNVDAGKFSIQIRQSITKNNTQNIVGILPGKTKPGEYVIFAGHYDHLGYGKPDEKGDSLYNGANDDASGITAVLMLAKYYKKLNNNERTLVFVAFTAEEMGGLGSEYFSTQIEADKVVAMFNLEMIGTESKGGKNSVYITGYEKSDLGKILEKNLQGSAFTLYPDPYPAQKLFYRSDNATLAKLGVPAHTISTSKMDDEPHYHKASDEIKTLDLGNMTEIIKSVAISAQSIVAGKDTPTRIVNEKMD